MTDAQLVIDDSLDLPFGLHFCPNEGKERGSALVFTTEPANGEPNEEDRVQCDVLAVLDADNGDKFGNRASELGEFVTDALNAYVATPEGLAHWKRVHPIMEQMRNAGRQ